MERHPLAEARGESVQAPTTNLPSNDPWRDEESPQTPETPRLVLECEKPSSAKDNAGKQREKDRRSRWRKKPDATTKTETHLHPGPTRTRKPSTPDVDTPAWQTGKTPARHSDAPRIIHLIQVALGMMDEAAWSLPPIFADVDQQRCQSQWRMACLVCVAPLRQRRARSSNGRPTG